MPLSLPALLDPMAIATALQYEQRMLPPRADMEKLEDDILKQVRDRTLFGFFSRWAPFDGIMPLRYRRHFAGLLLPVVVLALLSKTTQMSRMLLCGCRCTKVWTSPMAAQS